MKRFKIISFLVCCLASLSFTQTTLVEAVDFTATDVHGVSHTLFSYLDAGQYVLLNFTSTT